MNTTRLLVAAATALTLCAVGVVPRLGFAQEGQDWVAAKFKAAGLDPETVTTFETLLHDELRTQLRIRLRLSGDTEPCGNLTCAVPLGKKEGALVVVYGSIAVLGADILVRAGFYDVAADKDIASHKMTVNKVEDLALTAERIASAVAHGRTVEEATALGTVVEKEVAPARRREGDRGLALQLAGIAPLGKAYADADFGVNIGLSYWFETNDFVIEPRIGFRFSTNRDTKNGGVFSEIPMEIAGYYVFTRTDVAPFLGASFGARYGWEEDVLTEKTPTSVLEETTIEKVSARGWGAGGTVRVGLLLMRTYAMRVAVSLDYGIAYLEQVHTSMPQSLTFGVSAMF